MIYQLLAIVGKIFKADFVIHVQTDFSSFQTVPLVPVMDLALKISATVITKLDPVLVEQVIKAKGAINAK